MTLYRAKKLDRAKRQLIEACLDGHNEKAYPASREAQIVVITRAFRVLESIWKSCGPEEVWSCIRLTSSHSAPMKPFGYVKVKKNGRWLKREL